MFKKYILLGESNCTQDEQLSREKQALNLAAIMGDNKFFVGVNFLILFSFHHIFFPLIIIYHFATKGSIILSIETREFG